LPGSAKLPCGLPMLLPKRMSVLHTRISGGLPFFSKFLLCLVDNQVRIRTVSGAGG
jgi:hypothetical protein